MSGERVSEERLALMLKYWRDCPDLDATKLAFDLADARSTIATLTRERDEARGERDCFVEQIAELRESALHHELQRVMAMHNEALSRIATLEAQAAAGMRAGLKRAVEAAAKASWNANASLDWDNDKTAIPPGTPKRDRVARCVPAHEVRCVREREERRS